MSRPLLRDEYKMARHFPSLRENSGYSARTSMFIQDAALPVIPTAAFDDDECKVELSGSDQEKVKAASLLTKLSRDRHGSIQKVATGAINEVAANLAWRGRVFYELVDRGDAEIVPNRFTSERLLVTPFFCIQSIPKEDRRLWKKRLGFLWSHQFWRVAMPSTLGGPCGYSKVLRRLNRYDTLGPNFFRKGLEQGNISDEFDFQEYSYNIDVFMNHVSRTWGWNRRDSGQDRATEYYYFYKTAQFHRAQAILREHILVEINALLQRLNIQSQVAISGVISSEEIKKKIEALEVGEINFEDLSQILAN
ncbi:hypothetical protein R0137_09720 [Congregibacter brevis]|uniref:Uncharacterized protein n=1 Tax=Congregibacter brevis TaxID=3081201 RepID=A0ABZ0I7N9_9GAMM|nr:hypothetical protein R0137_09720 [Congregibacter sp. IMCC45268]